MALQLGALRDALLEAGATAETANKAAEELATQGQRFADLRFDMRVLRIQMNFVIGVMVLIGLPSLRLLVRIGASINALPL